MKEVLIFSGFLAAWMIFNRWVLPRFGVQT